MECGDYVKIRDGLASWDIPLKKYCGHSHVGDDWIEATSNAMRVEFVTNSHVGGVGFTAEYTSSGSYYLAVQPLGSREKRGGGGLAQEILNTDDKSGIWF